MVDEFLAEEAGPLTPTPLAEYRNDNSQATINNSRVGRFWGGWSACAWKAAVAEDQAALARAKQCLDLLSRVHRESGGIQIVPDPNSPPNRYYYHAICGVRPESAIGLVELMRIAGFADEGVLAGFVERLIALAGSAVAGCVYLHERNAPYWNGDTCGGAGLLATASVLPEHPDAPRWREVGWRNISEFFDERDFLADGSFHEAFPCAEGYGLSFLFSTIELLRGRERLDVSELRLSPIRTLRDAVQWHLDVASPLGELPSINDTNAYDSCIGENNGAYSHLLVLGQWVGLPEVWKAFRADDYQLPLHVYAHRPQALPERRSESLVLPDVGWSFIRSGAGRDSFQVMFDHGRHQSGHCMPQCLTFDLICEGYHWLVNSGGAPHYCTYDEQNTWHRRTKAANCIVVDGEDIPAQTNGELLDWSEDGGCITVRACHRGYPAVLHERTLVYEKDGPLVAIDRLLPSDGREHSAQVFWHVNGRVDEKEKGGWIFKNDDAMSFVLLSALLAPETTVQSGLCGGLDGRNRGASKLASVEVMSPGDPGWRFVPYLTLDISVPSAGIILASAFVPLRDGGEESYRLETTDLLVRVLRDGETVLEAPIDAEDARSRLSREFVQ